MADSKPRTLVMIDVTDDENDPLTPKQWADFNEELYHGLVHMPEFGLRSNTYSHATDDERRTVYVAWVDTDALDSLRQAIRRARERCDVNSVGLAIIDNIELI